MNNRGNAILDSFTVIIVLFVFGFLSVIGFMVSDEVNTDIQGSDDFSNDTKDIVNNLNNRYVSTFDSLFLLLFFLMWGFVLYASFQVDSHPIFFILAVLLFVFVLFVAGVLSNSWDELSSDADTSQFAQDFTITDYILDNFLLMLIPVGFSVIIVLYGKNRFLT